MAEKRPNIYLFFTTKKSKPTNSTEDTTEVNSEKVPNECLDLSFIVIDDELEKDASTSLINSQSEEHSSQCRLICCTSLTVYVLTNTFEFQSTSGKDKRSCQAAWFTTYS